LLYHPVAPIVRTPANVALRFDSIGFATAADGVSQLHGWWIPAGPESRYTAIYLHGADGNLSDSVDAFTPLHRAGLTVFAFDYRGYGQSQFARPSQMRLREDAGSAIGYLTNTRHISAGSIVLVGRDLGANLALEVAAAHPELAGVVLENPLESPTAAIFSDPRAHLVPAHALVSDRWDLNAAAANLRISSLWFYWTPAKNADRQEDAPNAYQKVTARKSLVWLTDSPGSAKDYDSALSRWLDDLPATVNSR
jgi:pimeloyl-ACP methyl ester carboxylesterase